jgi:dipeptidyl-peptidase-4
MADDNVLFTHSTKLFSLLQEKGKSFEMMTYPGSKHAMFGQTVQTHLHQTITEFFDRTLKGTP